MDGQFKVSLVKKMVLLVKKEVKGCDYLGEILRIPRLYYVPNYSW